MEKLGWSTRYAILVTSDGLLSIKPGSNSHMSLIFCLAQASADLFQTFEGLDDPKDIDQKFGFYNSNIRYDSFSVIINHINGFSDESRSK